MKRYVSLASALLIGTVVAHKKVAVAESTLVRANNAAAAKDFKVAAALEAKKPVYASDVSDLNDDKQDVQANNKPQKSTASNKTSAREVDPKNNDKKSAQSSATSARVAAKDSIKSEKDPKEKDDVKSNSVSSATTPQGVEEVDTSVTSEAQSVNEGKEDQTSVETSNTSDNQQVENSVDSKETSAATSNTSNDQKVENSVNSKETSAVTSNTSDNQKVEADDDSECSSATSDNQKVEESVETSNTSDDQQVEHCGETPVDAESASQSADSSVTTPEGVEADVQSASCESDAQQNEAILDNEESVNSSATSGAPGMKAGNYSEVSSTPEGVEADNDDDLTTPEGEDCDSVDDNDVNNLVVTDKDIEDMLMNVYIEHGFLGDCGVNYKELAVGDTYWCQDKQLNKRTACEKQTSKLHLCCIEDDGCNDLDDMKSWRFA